MNSSLAIGGLGFVETPNIFGFHDLYIGDSKKNSRLPLITGPVHLS
jgi:hypothetical protein